MEQNNLSVVIVAIVAIVAVFTMVSNVKNYQMSMMPMVNDKDEQISGNVVGQVFKGVSRTAETNTVTLFGQQVPITKSGTFLTISTTKNAKSAQTVQVFGQSLTLSSSKKDVLQSAMRGG